MPQDTPSAVDLTTSGSIAGLRDALRTPHRYTPEEQDRMARRLSRLDADGGTDEVVLVLRRDVFERFVDAAEIRKGEDAFAAYCEHFRRGTPGAEAAMRWWEAYYGSLVENALREAAAELAGVAAAGARR